MSYAPDVQDAIKIGEGGKGKAWSDAIGLNWQRHEVGIGRGTRLELGEARGLNWERHVGLIGWGS